MSLLAFKLHNCQNCIFNNSAFIIGLDCVGVDALHSHHLKQTQIQLWHITRHLGRSQKLPWCWFSRCDLGCLHCSVGEEVA